MRRSRAATALRSIRCSRKAAAKCCFDDRARGGDSFALAGLSISCARSPTPERAVAPEGPAAPIREFDISTLEKLAQEIYVQDKFAWIATDVLLAHRTEKAAAAEGVEHWIIGQRDGQTIIRFIRVGDRGPEALYDVAFPETGNPTFSSPVDRTLAPEEIAQYKARTLALKNIARACSDRYNTVALRDPESDGWLVWALAASLDPKAMLIGGHYRFTISPDGETIRARDALSCTCLSLTKEDQANPFMNHLVSLTPVETHEFASLTYGKILHVGTEDGRAWRIDPGRIIRVDQDAPGEEDSPRARSRRSTRSAP